MSSVYVIEYPTVSRWRRRVRWAADLRDVALFKHYEPAKDMAEAFTGDQHRVIVSQSGALDVLDVHTATDNRGRPLWRIVHVIVSDTKPRNEEPS